MPTPRIALDPAFPATLRGLREARGWSYRDLARRAFITGTYVWQIENGDKSRPSMKTVAALDHALAADGALVAMARPALPAVAGPDDRDRIVYAARHPTRLDGQAVAALVDVLAAHRRLDDTVPAHILIPGEVAQWETVDRLARDARGPAGARLRLVAAEWTQYVGWLRAEARHDVPAIDTLTRAVEQALDVGAGSLAAQARNFLGYVQRQRQNPRGIADSFEAAYRTPGATRLQRVGDAAQAAHGYALAGDRPTAVRLLGEAQDLMARADADEAPPWSYWLSATFGRMNLGLVYLALGDRREAARQLRAALDGLPPDQQDAGWTVEYRQALADADGAVS